jgi:hypothetical protein
VDDSKGKARFRTTDGVLGDFAGEPAPSIGVGESVEAWITNVGQNIYTLTRREDIATRHAKPPRDERAERRVAERPATMTAKLLQGSVRPVAS